MLGMSDVNATTLEDDVKRRLTKIIARLGQIAHGEFAFNKNITSLTLDLVEAQMKGIRTLIKYSDRDARASQCYNPADHRRDPGAGGRA
jgi:hypothetical protein